MYSDFDSKMHLYTAFLLHQKFQSIWIHINVLRLGLRLGEHHVNNIEGMLW
jgi:hypothetical protein